MKYEVYFSNSLETLLNEEFLFEADAIEDVLPRIPLILKEHREHTEPYCRWMFPSIGMAIDYGSWSRFIIITNVKMEDVL